MTPSASQFDAIFAQNAQRGGSLDDIQIYRRRGGSLFGVLGNIFKRSLPFLRSIILPEFGGFVKSVAEDVSQNMPVKKSMKRNFISSAKNVGRRVVRGGSRVKKAKRLVKRKKSVKRKKGKSKKRTKKTRTRKKKRCSHKTRGDIFSSGIFSGV